MNENDYNANSQSTFSNCYGLTTIHEPKEIVNAIEKITRLWIRKNK